MTNNYYYIIAGTFDQFFNYVKGNPVPPKGTVNYQYVSQSFQLRGLRGPIKGKFIGTFRQNPHIRDIILQIQFLNHEDRPLAIRLEKILQEL